MNGPLYKNTDPGDGTVVNVSFWSCLAAPRPDEKESGELLTREGTDKLKLVTAADRAGQWVPEGGEGGGIQSFVPQPQALGPGPAVSYRKQETSTACRLGVSAGTEHRSVPVGVSSHHPGSTSRGPSFNGVPWTSYSP